MLDVDVDLFAARIGTGFDRVCTKCFVGDSASWVEFRLAVLHILNFLVNYRQA